jgi:hypothetical protein
MAKSGKQARADLESALSEANRLTETALRLSASHADGAEEAFSAARDAITKTRGERLDAYYASTGSNPDLGTPLEKAALGALAERAWTEMIAAERKIFGHRGAH